MLSIVRPQEEVSRLSIIIASCLLLGYESSDWLLTQGSVLCKLYLYEDRTLH